MIELIVVVVILAILSSLVFFSYQSVFARGQNDPAQEALTTLAAEELTYYQTYGSFAATATTLAGLEPNFSYVTGTAVSTGAGQVSADSGTISGTPALGLAILGDSGSCVVINVEAPSSSRANLTDQFTPSVSRPCSGSYALSDVYPGSPW